MMLLCRIICSASVIGIFLREADSWSAIQNKRSTLGIYRQKNHQNTAYLTSHGRGASELMRSRTSLRDSLSTREDDAFASRMSPDSSAVLPSSLLYNDPLIENSYVSHSDSNSDAHSDTVTGSDPYSRSSSDSDAMFRGMSSDSDDVTSDQKTFEGLIRSIICSKDNLEKRARDAEILFYQLMKAGYIPSKDITVSLIRLMGELNEPDKADNIFDRVSFAGAVCDVSIYNSLIIAWASSTMSNAVLKAEDLLERIEFAELEPDSESFEGLLTAWSTSNRKDAAIKCVNILQKMMNLNLIPSIEAYEKTFAILAESSLTDAPELGMILLDSLTGNTISQTASQNSEYDTMTSTADYEIDDGFEVSEKSEKSAKRVKKEQIVLKGQNKQKGNTARSPSRYCYENLIAIWLKSSRDESSSEISGIVRMMERSSRFLPEDFTNVYSALVISLCTSDKRNKLIDIDKADERLVSMEQRGMDVPPGVFSLLITSWCKLGNPQRAEVALDRLASVLLSNSLPTRATPNTIEKNKKGQVSQNGQNNQNSQSGQYGQIGQKGLKGQKEQKEHKRQIQQKNILPSLLLHDVKITALPWNRVIAAYGALRSERTDVRTDTTGTVRTNEIENEMKIENGLEERSVEEDEDVFLLHRARNADRVYAKLVHLFSMIGKERRERTIIELSSLSSIRPDRWTYSALISIWACCGKLDKAEAKLSLMVRNGIRASPVTYAALLRGWLKRYSTAIDISASIASSKLLTLDPVSDISGFYDKNDKKGNNGKIVKKDKRSENNGDNEMDEGVKDGDNVDNESEESDRRDARDARDARDNIKEDSNDNTNMKRKEIPVTAAVSDMDSDYLDAVNSSDVKILIDTALFRVKKLFGVMCRLTYSYREGGGGEMEEEEEDDSIGSMLGLEDGDGAYYCQDAFNRIVDAGISPTLEMYKEVLRLLSKNTKTTDTTTDSERNEKTEKLGKIEKMEKLGNSEKIERQTLSTGSGMSSSSEYGGASSTADRAVTLFQHLVGVGGYHPDLECYELLVRAFEVSSLSLKSSSSRLTQTYPSRALEVAEHMLATGITPSRSLYESLLRMWVISRRPDSPRIAESIFRSMVSCTYSISSYLQGDSGTSIAAREGDGEDGDGEGGGENDGKPSKVSFLLLLEAWARSPLPNAAMKAEEVVQTMVAAGVPPDQRAYSLLAYAWSKSWKWESNSGPSVLRRESALELSILRGVSVPPGESSEVSEVPSTIDIVPATGSGGGVNINVGDLNGIESTYDDSLIDNKDESEDGSKDTDNDRVLSTRRITPSAPPPVPLGDVISGNVRTSRAIDIEIETDDYPLDGRTDGPTERQTEGQQSLFPQQQMQVQQQQQQQQQKQQEQTVYRRRGEFVNRTEDALFRCLGSGLAPDISMRRSLLSVWCRDRVRGGVYNSEDSEGEGEIENNLDFTNDSVDSNDGKERITSEKNKVKTINKKISSIQKAEDLLARISLITAARLYEEQGLLPHPKYSEIASNSLAARIVKWDTLESAEDLKPHPSVYMQLAGAWNEADELSSERSSERSGREYSSGFSGRFSGGAVNRAESFLRRMNDDLFLLEESIRINPRNYKDNIKNNGNNGNNGNSGNDSNDTEYTDDNNNGNIRSDGSSEDNKDDVINIDEEIENKVYREIFEGIYSGTDSKRESTSKSTIESTSEDEVVKVARKVAASTEDIAGVRAKERGGGSGGDREGKRGEEDELLLPSDARSEGLYVSYNLLLAAHAICSTGTGKCNEAEAIYKKMVTSSPSSPSSSISSLFIYPRADVVSTNLLVEGIRLSGGSNIVERCERLWYSDSTSTSSDSTYVSPGRTGRTDSSDNKDSSKTARKTDDADNIYDKDDRKENTDDTQNAADTKNDMNAKLLTVKALHLLNNRGASSFTPDKKEKEPKEQLTPVAPNDFTFELMSRIWVENRAKDIAVRSQSLFDRLRCQAGSRSASRQPYFLSVPVLSPSVASYSALVLVRDILDMIDRTQYSWADLDPQRASDIVDRMTSDGLAPAYQVFSKLMETWAKRMRRDKCDDILMKMLAAGYKPDPLSCRLLLSVHASTDLADSAERTEEALARLLQAGVRMDQHLLMSQLQAWSKSRSPIAANKAEAALAKGMAAGVRPSVTLFNVLLDTHGKSRQPDAPERAEDVLHRMKAEGITPQICSYNAAIAAWGRSYRKDAEERSALIFAQALRDGAEPNVITFSSLLSALSRSRDKNAPLRADNIFERMIEAGVQPDTRAWTILITIWSRSRVEGKEDIVQEIFERMLAAGAPPSEVTYTALLSMWGNSRHPKASDRVVEVFQRMRSAGRRLDTVGYSSLLSALSRSTDKNSPYRADEVFEQMLGAGIKADPMAWTILITLWSKSRIPGKETKVQQIFKRMVSSGEQPNAVTYTSLLIMWSKSRLPQAKDNILRIYDRIWDEYVRLDGMAFEVLISSLQRACSQQETLRRADMLMTRLVDFEMPPDARAWSSVIDADRTYGPGSQCHVRALRLYRKMTQSGVKPTLEVFNSVLSAIARSGDLSSPQIQEAIFAQMKQYNMTPHQNFKVVPREIPREQKEQKDQQKE